MPIRSRGAPLHRTEDGVRGALTILCVTTYVRVLFLRDLDKGGGLGYIPRCRTAPANGLGSGLAWGQVLSGTWPPLFVTTVLSSYDPVRVRVGGPPKAHLS